MITKTSGKPIAVRPDIDEEIVRLAKSLYAASDATREAVEIAF